MNLSHAIAHAAAIAVVANAVMDVISARVENYRLFLRNDVVGKR
jgi:hypothetical protein